MAKKENTFEEICRDIVAKKFQPVYILMGEEPFFMDRITDLLIENVLAESERDFNQMIMYGADTDAAMIINAARRFPMMSEYQLVVVREAQLVRDIELLTNYVKIRLSRLCWLLTISIRIWTGGKHWPLQPKRTGFYSNRKRFRIIKCRGLSSHLCSNVP